MKFVAGIILVIFVSFGQSVILNCQFHMETRGLGNLYECESQTENTGNSTIIEEVHGTHLSGKGNADVESFFEHGMKLTSFPTNLASFFLKLKAILITAPILKLSSNDLKPFRDLVRFETYNGKFTSIDGDLFQHTRKLKYINFRVPELKNVGANLLTGLNDLVFVWFEGSGCIGTFNARTPQLIEQLNQKLLSQCPCSLRCSLDSEVDELRSKLDLQREKFKTRENDQWNVKNY
jgi:hypothetical protein